MRVALATVPNHASLDERIGEIERALADAAVGGAAIACFPEAYLPGLRGNDFEVPPLDQAWQEAALARIQAVAARHGVAVILPMEWATPAGSLNLAFVIDRDGSIQGYQAKNQIPPSEEPFYVPDGQRRLFEVDEVPFGIAICHEAWRFPETVRWAARRGAKVVFHPQLTGSDQQGNVPAFWGDPAGPYYEKAMLARAVENSVYFASVNNAFRFPESATTIIGPDGDLVARAPYGERSVLVADLNLDRATGFHARRYDPNLYPP